MTFTAAQFAVLACQLASIQAGILYLIFRKPETHAEVQQPDKPKQFHRFTPTHKLSRDDLHLPPEGQIKLDNC